MPLTLTPWRTPSRLPRLTAEAVHLWRFSLDCHEPLEHLLDEQELVRARRLRCPAKARSFVVARARLRQLLAAYLELEPKAVTFAYGPAGKPGLGDLADAPVFNLSHSGDWALFAVARQGALGIDVETVNPDLDYMTLAERFFSTLENRYLQACPEWRRRREFFRLWTRKEAWLKGKGGGFSDPQQDLGAEHLGGCCTFSGGWWLRSIPIGRNVLAALAVSRQYSSVLRLNGWR